LAITRDGPPTRKKSGIDNVYCRDQCLV